ncbi:MAG: type II and III secretion system protein family protein [Desulfobacterales bacterium]|jgi:pilus assembly protein CpaC|nr:type II and III secretion system protein family protein [Desulfobacterales bacterium]
MFRLLKIELTRSVCFLWLAGLLVCPAIASAVDSVVVDNTSVERLHLDSGKSTILRSTYPLQRVSVADPEVADYLLLSPRELYITGKTAGTTNLTLWRDNSVLAVYNLEVGYNLSGLKEQLHTLFPTETELKVLRMNDTIMLSGRMSNTNNLAQAVALAESYALKGKVNNLVEVGGGHQVMLEVRVAEISKQTGKRLGINFSAVNEDNLNNVVVSMLGGLTQLVGSDDANIGTISPTFSNLVSSNVNALYRFSANDVTYTALIDALQEDGMAKVLAKPTLVALSGQSASFLAGGEFPVPVPQGLGTVAIEYKDFGVKLNFTPIVLGNNRISINVTPKISELDFTTAVRFSGFVIPGLTSRSASTTVELGDGQSFAIAGLLNENIRDSISKYPFLGDIPVLGVLFRSRSFQKKETELVIVVTPRLVKPLNLAAQTLPTDFYVEPGDSEIYLEGVLQGKSPVAVSAAGLKMDGDFGHTMPE